MARKPTIRKGPAAAYEGSGEIIREVTTPSGDGFLLSVSESPNDGAMEVNVYRVTGRVTVHLAGHPLIVLTERS